MADRNLKIGNRVCWEFGGRHSKFYPKKNKLCGRLIDLNPSIAPQSYEVKLDKQSIDLLDRLDNTINHGTNPTIYPLREVVRKPRK